MPASYPIRRWLPTQFPWQWRPNRSRLLMKGGRPCGQRRSSLPDRLHLGVPVRNCCWTCRYDRRWRLLRTTEARVCAGRGRGIVFSKDFSDFHERGPGLIAPVFSLYPAGDMLNLERHMRRLGDANYAPDAPLRSLGIDVPIILAGMGAGATSATFAAAV